MYGDSLSPILAHFQKMPLNLLLHEELSALIAGWRKEYPVPLLVAVHDGREYRVQIGRCADGEENDQEQTLKVEEGRLSGRTLAVAGR